MRKATAVTSKPTPATLPPCCIPKLDPRAQRLVLRALKALEDSAVYRTEAMNNPSSVRTYLKLRFAGLEREEFHAIWLDVQNRIIAAECISTGTVTSTSVYPREVMKAALAHNASAVIFAHNHPSGKCDPSDADKTLTTSLKGALDMIDVRVHDHMIAGGAQVFSFRESGLL